MLEKRAKLWGMVNKPHSQKVSWLPYTSGEAWLAQFRCVHFFVKRDKVFCLLSLVTNPQAWSASSHSVLSGQTLPVLLCHLVDLVRRMSPGPCVQFHWFLHKSLTFTLHTALPPSLVILHISPTAIAATGRRGNRTCFSGLMLFILKKVLTQNKFVMKNRQCWQCNYVLCK